MTTIIKHIFPCVLLAVTLMVAACSTQSDQPEQSKYSFSGTQGGGSNATGGRRGSILFVTSLEDDATKEGTLRYALAQATARTILFRVSGRIDLKSELKIKQGNVSIFGESAPGDGICISGYPVVIDADNVIIRFLHFRMGDENKVEGDALTCIGHKNILIDHCSFSWSTDECVSCYGNTNFTLQYCFITESLRISIHGKGKHGYGGIWGGTNASFHHNLLAHHDSRNPRFDHDFVNVKCAGPIDYVNNVVYNWGDNSTYGGESLTQQRKINMVANYYKYGQATADKCKYRLLNATTYCTNCTSSGIVQPGSFYLEGNYMFGSSAVTADNWKGVVVDRDGTATVDDCKSDTRHSVSNEITAQTAEEAFETVLAKAGCSLHRDAIDIRIANEVRNGTYTYTGKKGSTGGLIDTQSDVGGWPTYNSTTPLQDSDGDGIPDSWETANGLNPHTYSDGNAITLGAPYTNLEVYLNSLVQNLYD